MRRHSAGWRGQAIVEFALMTPVIFLMLFGVFDFGRAVADYVALSHVTYEGARAAALMPATPPGSNPGSTDQDIAAGNAVIGVIQSQGGVLDPVSQSQVNVGYSWCSPSIGSNKECRTVRAIKTFTPLTPIISNIVGTLSLSKSAMAVVQD
jgi:hypothetical protein